MEQSPIVEVSGILSRFSMADGRAGARITPFAFSWDADAKPVWSVVFVEPSFTIEAVQAYLDAEVDIDVFPQEAVVYDVWRGTQQVLGASHVTVDQVAYDAADLQAHLLMLEAQTKRLRDRLQLAVTKNDKGRAIVQELLRRAEIKAAGSDRLRERQAAAIAVLKRLVAHFGD